MPSNVVFKKSLLAVAVAMSMSSYSTMTLAECSADAPEGASCETIIVDSAGQKAELDSAVYVTSGNGIEFVAQPDTKYGVFKSNGHNVTVTGEGAVAVLLGDQSQLDFDITLTGGSHIVSENGTAIVIDGGFDDNVGKDNPVRGVMIKDGSVVRGKEVAIDFSGADTAVRIDVDGSIIGNVIGSDLDNNKINFGNAGNKIVHFDGKLISGVSNIDNYGQLTIRGKDESVVWQVDKFNNKDDAIIHFIVDNDTNLNEALLDIQGEAAFGKNSSVGMRYTGSDINNIIGKEITLLEADQISNPANVNIDKQFQESLSPLLTGDSWVSSETGLSGAVTDNRVVVEVGVVTDVAGSTTDFIKQAHQGGSSEEEMIASGYIVSTALNQYNQGGGNDVASIMARASSASAGQLVALLASTGTDAQLTAALSDELTPDAEGGEVRSALAMVQQMERNLDVRTNYLRNQSYLSSSQDGWNFWVNGIYSDAQLKNTAQSHGYDLSMMGTSIGMDRVFDDNKLFGVSGAMAYSDVEIAGNSNTKDVESYQFMTYLGWFNDNYFVDGNFNIGLHNNSSTRYVGTVTGYQGNQRAEADYSSHQMGYRITAGARLDFDKLMIQPQVSYGYQWLRVEDYAENGSPAALKYDRKTYVANEFGIGAIASQSFRTDLGVLTPSLTMMAYRDLSNDEVIQESAGLVSDTNDGRFIITGDSVGDNSFFARLGADMEMLNGINLGGGLAFYTRGDYEDIALSVNANWRF